MNNDSWERVLGTFRKIDNIDIILKHKPGRIYKRKTWFTRKKVYV